MPVELLQYLKNERFDNLPCNRFYLDGFEKKVTALYSANIAYN